MSRVTILHNPRCSKSRQTLELLNQFVSNADVVEYLKTPPDQNQILEICKQLGLRPTQIVRTSEARFSELNLSLEDDRSDSEWCGILSDNPILIERPIVISGDKAVVGRPPENVRNLF